MAAHAFITGIAGTTLSADERAFLRQADPWGLILFARNIQSPDQVSRLIEEFRATVGRGDAPVLIDQEGGRVQRLGPPHWPAYPPAATFGRLYQADPSRGVAAARLGARLIAADLAALGITVDCLPVADVPVPGSDRVIGDRAYGTDAEQVAVLAGAAAAGLLDGGVLPVLKHIPGHGRATADSHHQLPVVTADRATLEATDFAAFRRLAHLPLAMTAHIVFTALDPDTPATISSTIVGDVIRGSIGFDGVLMSDDVSMGALAGTISARSGAAIKAGCDLVLHCNGQLDEMQAVASAVPRLDGPAARRAAAALAACRAPDPIDQPAARAEFSGLIGPISATG